MQLSPDLATPAATSDKRLVTALRQMILDGRLAAGDKISEVRVSEMFDVSRTPARLALSALEVEGLIRKRAGRGYTVLDLNFGDLSKAYEVRGVLEALAAGTLARMGMSDEVEQTLIQAVDDIDRALASDLPVAERVAGYQDGNTLFHETIMRNCGNDLVGFTFDRLSGLPLLKLGTLVFNAEKSEEELMRLHFGNMQHRIVLDALRKRDVQRAEVMMREHANQVPVYTSLLV